jgi:hypothetical protein
MSYPEREKVKLLHRLRKLRGAREQIAPDLAEDLIELVRAYVK